MTKVIPVKKTDAEKAEETKEFQEQVARISAEYKAKPNKPRKPLVGEATSMRERILALSLFPNVINKYHS